MKNDVLIVIPTLNEKGNVSKLAKKILSIIKNVNILFIDDSSQDGTKDEIINLNNTSKKINFIFRPKKLGIGSAHKKGIQWGYKKKFSFIITMDCDGTHDPIYINKMLKVIKDQNTQLVSTNRFLKKNSLSDWSAWRKILTRIRHILIKQMLNIQFDSSGAFRCYSVKEINIKDILKAKNDSYSFFWESMFFLSKKYQISEISINLPGRLSGSSKMKISDILKAFLYLCYIFFKHRF
jgi:dolichol-phosphate mannosyltransferase